MSNSLPISSPISSRQQGPRLEFARRPILALSLILLSQRGSRAEAAQLIFLERRDCPFCRLWLHEVGEYAWNSSELGQRAPLRRIDIAAGLPPDLSFLEEWRITPTFVLVIHGREVGRITGYNGPHFFWQQAEALIRRLHTP